MASFRIATCLYPIERMRSFEQWTQKMSSWVAQACANGARVLLFPEYGSLETLDLVASKASTLQELFVAHQQWLGSMRALFQSLAEEYGVVIFAGSWLEQVHGELFNRSWAFAPGQPAQWADKVMLTPEERRLGFRAGSQCSVFDTSSGRLGVAVCYDSEFPQIGRKLVEAGAEVILVPSCTDTVSGYHRVRIGCQARALENQCYVVQAATTGTAPWSRFLDENHGAAALFVAPDTGFPADGVIASGRLDEPGWVYGEIDVEFLRESRRQSQVSGREDWVSDQHLLIKVQAKPLC